MLFKKITEINLPICMKTKVSALIESHTIANTWCREDRVYESVSVHTPSAYIIMIIQYTYQYQMKNILLFSCEWMVFFEKLAEFSLEVIK